MNIFEKIKAIYPSLTDDDFNPRNDIIRIQNDSDGKGDYIAKWEHPTLARPTEQQLDGAK
jgi:XkdW protein